jgi:hypothetical protein
MPILKPLLLLCCLVVQMGSAQSAAAERIADPKMRRRCIKPLASFGLDAKINEGSGLAVWNGRLWTHNDSGTATLFALDTTGKIMHEYPLSIPNADFEDLSQDDDYFYLGAFGNNLGNKDTLRIYKIGKASLLADEKPTIEAIVFSWPETVTYGKRTMANFDCEAMVVVGDSIYLFTKEWKKGRRTRLFSLPKKQGSYVASYKSTLKTRVLVTGASFVPAQKRLVLCGYNLWLRPFLLVFSMDGFGAFPEKGTKIKVRRPFRQMEGIAFDGSEYFLINEDFHFLFLHTRQQLHRLELE